MCVVVVCWETETAHDIVICRPSCSSCSALAVGEWERTHGLGPCRHAADARDAAAAASLARNLIALAAAGGDTKSVADSRDGSRVAARLGAQAAVAVGVALAARRRRDANAVDDELRVLANANTARAAVGRAIGADSARLGWSTLVRAAAAAIHVRLGAIFDAVAAAGCRRRHANAVAIAKAADAVGANNTNLSIGARQARASAAVNVRFRAVDLVVAASGGERDAIVDARAAGQRVGARVGAAGDKSRRVVAADNSTRAIVISWAKGWCAIEEIVARLDVVAIRYLVLARLGVGAKSSWAGRLSRVVGAVDGAAGAEKVLRANRDLSVVHVVARRHDAIRELVAAREGLSSRTCWTGNEPWPVRTSNNSSWAIRVDRTDRNHSVQHVVTRRDEVAI